MNLFDRYLLKRYCLVLGGVMLVFITLAIIFQLVEELDSFIRYDAEWIQVLRYLVLSLPHVVVQFMPLVVLLSLVFTIHQLMKWGEITGIMASGASLRRISAGFLLVGILVGVFQFLSNEYVAAWSEDQARRIMNYEIKRRQAGVTGTSGLFLRGAENRFYHCLYFDRERKIMHQVEIYQPDESNRFLSRYIRARLAVYVHGEWTFLEGEEYLLRRSEIISQTPFKSQVFKLTENPDDFMDLVRRPRSMSYRELRHHMDVIASSGEDPSRHLTELHLKLAFPGACLIFTLIALSVSLRMKAGNLSVELGITLVAAFGYYMLTILLTKLGNEQVLPGLLAGWGTTLIFGLVSFYFFTRTRTDY